jgi:small subunit ribosomal protein S6
MRKYEVVMLIDHDVPHQGVAVIAKKIESLLGSSGKVVHSEYWGLRELAYPIKKHKKARYFMLSISAGSDVIKSITDYIRINESIVRSGIYSVDFFDAGSPMLSYKKGLLENVHESDYRAAFPNPIPNPTTNTNSTEN